MLYIFFYCFFLTNRNKCFSGLSPFEYSVSSILAKNSQFRKHANLLNTIGDGLPYDALHGYLRAKEESHMLKDEAISVLRYGNDVVNNLTAAAKDPEVGVNISDEDLGTIGVCKQKLVGAKRWYEEQKTRLTKIAAGLRSVSTTISNQEEDDEQTDEVDDEEPAAQFNSKTGLKTLIN
ncbi:hypothetical protein BDB00DRAFT_151936 [Zychaea mexicana]|uniref:uncharacterized protein n=1 Tax=Zychaea mexicana TaxID=64656 RepID=UPI0022FDDA52|nr:uncharacterized protein BDB00DRAFT_151936 [Zychaea mexicana]KAI9484360.1 hypothetical protein BDB00DRAFT_151936 [Zychaea mexicana]